MAWRKLLVRLEASWSVLCVWVVRRSPLPPAQSVRLITRLSAALKLPCPCPVRSP